MYEFLCEDCNRVFSFLSRAAAASKRKAKYPKCGSLKMSRLLSRFAVARKSTSTLSCEQTGDAKSGTGIGSNLEADPRMDGATAELERDMASIDENNPRQVAAAMRRLSAATGEPLDPAMEEAVRRLGAGENPEKVEEAMADAFPEGAASDSSGTTTHDGGLYDL